MNCITIQHCIVRQWAGEKTVSRYNYCIVTEAKRGAGRAAGRWVREGCAGGRDRQLGEQACRRAGCWRAWHGAQRARGNRRGRRTGRVRLGRAGWPRLCTRPVFDPV